MFVGAVTFNRDLAAWDTSSVEDMYGMFSSATSFTSNLAVWNTGLAKNMGHMFFAAPFFTSDLALRLLTALRPLCVFPERAGRPPFLPRARQRARGVVKTAGRCWTRVEERCFRGGQMFGGGHRLLE